MQSVSSRIWTRVAVSISYDDDYYTMGVLFYQRSDFHMVINLSIALNALPLLMLISILVDEILLLRYIELVC